MTPFSEVFYTFKNKIIDYEFLDFTPDEEKILMGRRLKSALSKFKAKKRNIIADYANEVFNKELEEGEIEAIAFWLLYEWATPKVNNIEFFKHRLNTKEFQGYSEANHLKELKEIRDSAEKDAFYWSNQLSLDEIKDELVSKTYGL